MRTFLLSLGFLMTAACGADDGQSARLADDGTPLEETGGAAGNGAAGASGASGSATGGSAGEAATGGAASGGASGAAGAAGSPARRACRPVDVAPAYEGCEKTRPCTMVSECPSPWLDQCTDGMCVTRCHPAAVDPGVPCDGSKCVWWVGDTEVPNPTPDQCAAPESGFFCGGSESTAATACR